jgi:hypothetical protein
MAGRLVSALEVIVVITSVGIGGLEEPAIVVTGDAIEMIGPATAAEPDSEEAGAGMVVNGK